MPLGSATKMTLGALRILPGQQEEGLNASPSRLVRSLWPVGMLCRRQMKEDHLAVFRTDLRRIICRLGHPLTSCPLEKAFSKKGSLIFDLHVLGWV